MIQNSEDEKTRKGLLISLLLYIFLLVTVEDLQAIKGTREEERKSREKINTKNFQNKSNTFIAMANRLITMFHN